MGVLSRRRLALRLARGHGCVPGRGAGPALGGGRDSMVASLAWRRCALRRVVRAFLRVLPGGRGRLDGRGWLDGRGRRIAGPAPGAAPHEKPRGVRGQLLRDARRGVLDTAAQHLEIRRPAACLPLTDLPQPLGVTTLQTPRTMTLMRKPERVTTRRIIACPAPIPHPREIGPAKQFQLSHATNYPEHHPRSHAHIHDRQYQFCDQRHPTTNWRHAML